jgi:hypothetical protein
MNFKEFMKLRETGTSSGDIANYTLPIGMIIKRTWGVWSQPDDTLEIMKFNSSPSDDKKWNVVNKTEKVKHKKKKKK